MAGGATLSLTDQGERVLDGDPLQELGAADGGLLVRTHLSHDTFVEVDGDAAAVATGRALGVQGLRACLRP